MTASEYAINFARSFADHDGKRCKDILRHALKEGLDLNEILLLAKKYLEEEIG